MGSSPVLVWVVLLNATKLLFAMGVAVSTAGSLEEVDVASSTEVEKPVVDAKGSDACCVLLAPGGVDVGAAAV